MQKDGSLDMINFILKTVVIVLLVQWLERLLHSLDRTMDRDVSGSTILRILVLILRGLIVRNVYYVWDCQ